MNLEAFVIYTRRPSQTAEASRAPSTPGALAPYGAAIMAPLLGATDTEVARLLGDAPRSVENWVHHFSQQGLAGLTEGERSGRPTRLDEKQVKEMNRVLRAKPSDAGMRVNLWDGKTLSAWIDKTDGVQLGVRQCQRLFRQFEFRLRKPRPILARADPVRPIS